MDLALESLTLPIPYYTSVYGIISGLGGGGRTSRAVQRKPPPGAGTTSGSNPIACQLVSPSVIISYVKPI